MNQLIEDPYNPHPLRESD